MTQNILQNPKFELELDHHCHRHFPKRIQCHANEQKCRTAERLLMDWIFPGWADEVSRLILTTEEKICQNLFYTGWSMAYFVKWHNLAFWGFLELMIRNMAAKSETGAVLLCYTYSYLIHRIVGLVKLSTTDLSKVWCRRQEWRLACLQLVLQQKCSFSVLFVC